MATPHSSSSLARTGLLLFTAVGWVAASGANCPHIVQQYTQPLPQALPQSATLDQVIDVVNDNSSRIQSFSSRRATISSELMPASLRSTIVFERPRNFRLRADTAFTGQEVDLGSNAEFFWMWIKRNQPPAVFVCRHDQFATSPARQMLPVEPQWLIEALGVVTFDPNVQHEGPFPVQGGRLEIRSPLPEQRRTRITHIDESRGIVLEQHVYDHLGQRVASAVLSRHRRDPNTGVILPRRVQITWPPAKLDLTIDLEDVQINRIDGNPQELWAMPAFNGYRQLDLADPSLRPAEASADANPPTRIPPIQPYNTRY